MHIGIEYVYACTYVYAHTHASEQLQPYAYLHNAPAMNRDMDAAI